MRYISFLIKCAILRGKVVEDKITYFWDFFLQLELYMFSSIRVCATSQRKSWEVRYHTPVILSLGRLRAAWATVKPFLRKREKREKDVTLRPQKQTFLP